MDQLGKTANYLSDDKSIGFAAFFAGFIWSTPKIEQQLTNPLSSTWAGSGSGSIASFLAICVSRMMPEETRFLLTLSLVGSFWYHMYKSIKKEKSDSPHHKRGDL